MKIEFEISHIIRFLSAKAIILIILNIIMLIVYFYIGNPEQFNFLKIVDLDQEANLPTLFSSVLLMISAFLFYLLSKKAKLLKNKNYRYWLGLSFIFVFLAFDESAKIHESLGDWTEQFVDASGYLLYPWVISYAVLVFVLGLSYFRFFYVWIKRYLYHL